MAAKQQGEVIEQDDHGSIIVYRSSKRDRERRIEKDATPACSQLSMTPGQKRTLRPA